MHEFCATYEHDMHKNKIYDNESLLYIFIINYVLQCLIESREKI